MKKIRRSICSAFAAMLLLVAGNAGADIATDWTDTYNSPQNGYDAANKVAVDAGGNIIVAGTSGGSTSSWYDTNSDYLVIKYDAAGNKLWESRFNNPGRADNVTGLAVDPNGNIYVAGASVPGSGKWSALTVKFDANGTVQWSANWQHPWHPVAYASAIAVDAGGNAYIAGVTPYFAGNGYDWIVVKYGTNGAKQWQASYNDPVGNGDDSPSSIAVDGNGNVYAAGTIGGRTHGSYYVGRQYGLIKFNAGNGQRLWVRKYDGPAHGEDVATGMALDNSGNIYLTGYSDNRAYSGRSQAYFDYATVKYDPSGNLQWASRYNGTGNSTDIGRSIAVDANGNVSVTGYSIGSGTGYDYTTIRYDAAGTQQWVQRYDGPGSGNDIPAAVALDSSGNTYITGYSLGNGTGLDYATIKYDANGAQAWIERFNGAGNGDDSASSLALDADENVYVTGGSYSGSATGTDYVTIKYSQSQAPATPAEVAARVAEMAAEGCITNHGVANAIISSLENAERNLESSPRSAANMLGAAINKIEAQSGKKVCSSGADELIGYISAIIDTL